jgi:hypothetical protein
MTNFMIILSIYFENELTDRYRRVQTAHTKVDCACNIGPY